MFVVFRAYMMKSSNENIFRVTGHLCGNSPVPGEYPSQASDTELRCFYLTCTWINDWVNNREAGDLRRYRAHHDVIVMISWDYYSSPSYILYIHVPHGSSKYLPVASGWFDQNFRKVFFKLNSVFDDWAICWGKTFGWLSLKLTDDKPTLVQIKAQYRQATVHRPIQCWPRFMSEYGYHWAYRCHTT